MDTRRSRLWIAAIIGGALAALPACQSSQPTPEPRPHASGEGLSDTESAETAGEDAENLNLEKSSTQPSRRPPEVRRRRPVDQPRVRG